MFRKQDFKKVDLLGSGKKNTKIYKAEHIPTGKYYALKEVEAKTLEKLNEYKVSGCSYLANEYPPYRKKLSSCSRCRTIPMCFSSTDTTSTRLCTTPSESQWFASTWTPGQTWSTCSESANSKTSSGLRMNSRR